MEISDSAVEEFQQIWKREFDEELTLDEARMEARRLLHFYLTILKPLSGEKPKQ